MLDATGNLMNTYIHNPQEPAPFELTERIIYGSSRLGMHTAKVDLLNPVSNFALSSYTGEKLYEMSNHLGNLNDTWLLNSKSLSGINPDWSLSGTSGVLTVINDIKVPYESEGEIRYYATITNTSDYSPFGVTLDAAGGRTQYLDPNSRYRYGFNGMEKDDELKGKGNSYDFGARMHDTRLGRFFFLDPYMNSYGFQSPYVFAGNSPIQCIDHKGLYKVKVNFEMVNSRGNTVKYRAVFDTDKPNAVKIVNLSTRLSQTIKFESIEKRGKGGLTLFKTNYINQSSNGRDINRIMNKKFNGYLMTEMIAAAAEQNEGLDIYIIGNDGVSGERKYSTNAMYEGKLVGLNHWYQLDKNNNKQESYFYKNKENIWVIHHFDGTEEVIDTSKDALDQRWAELEAEYTRRRGLYINETYFNNKGAVNLDTI